MCLVYPIYVASFSGLSLFIVPLVFCNILLSCVVCTLCCQFLWIVLFSAPLVFSSIHFSCVCVPCVASFSGLPFGIAPSVFSNIYLPCVGCTPCFQFLWISLLYCPFSILQHLFVLCLVYPMLPVSLDCPYLMPLRYSLTFICPVSCIPYVASFSVLSILITPLVFSNVYVSCVLCTLCCQFLWIFFLHYPFGIL